MAWAWASSSISPRAHRPRQRVRRPAPATRGRCRRAPAPGRNPGASGPLGQAEEELEAVAGHPERLEDTADGGHVEVGAIAERAGEVLGPYVEGADQLLEHVDPGGIHERDVDGPHERLDDPRQDVPGDPVGVHAQAIDPGDRARLQPPRRVAVVGPFEIDGSPVRTREPDSLPGDRFDDRVGSPRFGGRFRERTPAADPAVGGHAVAGKRIAACRDGLHHDLVETGQRVPAERHARARRGDHLLDHDGNALRHGDTAAGSIGGDPIAVRRRDRADGVKDIPGGDVEAALQLTRERAQVAVLAIRRRPDGVEARRVEPAAERPGEELGGQGVARRDPARDVCRDRDRGGNGNAMAREPAERGGLRSYQRPVRRSPAGRHRHQRRRRDGVWPGCVGRPLGSHRRVRLAIVLAVMGEHDHGRARDRAGAEPGAHHRAGLRLRRMRRR